MPYPGAPPLPGGGIGFPELLGDINTVRDGYARFDLLDEQLRRMKGETP